MNSITEWMIEEGIAENGFAAGHIAVGLKLTARNADGKFPDRAEQERRCLLYRAWRPKTDKKNDIPAWQAYQLAIAGIDPADIEPRQIAFEDLEDSPWNTGARREARIDG